MNLSEKYGVVQCKAACSEFLQRGHIRSDNVCQVLPLAILFKRTELRLMCEELIGKKTKAVHASDGFLACDKRLLSRILDLDVFSCTETDVFKACMAWVKKASKQEQVTKELVEEHLGEQFYRIRYRSMPFDKFTEMVSSFGRLFSTDEYTEIIQMIGKARCQPSLFTAHRRLFPLHWNDDDPIYCIRWTNRLNDVYFIKNVESTTFQTNQYLLFGKLRWVIKNLDGEFAKFPQDHQVGVTVTREPQNEQPIILYEGDSRVTIHGNIRLLKPVLIGPDIDHEFQLTLNITEDTYHSDYVMETEVHMKSNIVVRFSNDPMMNSQPTGALEILHLNTV